MKLVITEKPSVAMDIARALNATSKGDGYLYNDEYVITWALGHLFNIDDSIAPAKWDIKSLPIFPEKFSYSLIRGKEKQFKVIRSLLSKSEVVINCGDAGREGELIIREILREANYVGKVLRFWTSEALTREVIHREFGNLKPSQAFDDLYYSALARQQSDWLVGINLTRLITLRAGGREVWSIGRVQTPTLNIVVMRDKEIEEFKPQVYYVVKAEFEGYEGILVKDGKILQLTEEDADKIVRGLSKYSTGIVDSINEELHSEPPPFLHSLTSLQREANTVYGISAQKTLDSAQRLYEEFKVISYPRTDARHMGDDARGLVTNVLKKLGLEELIPNVNKVGKRVFDSSKLTDHHAIIPLDVLPSNVTGIDKEIYDLILRKFKGVFMPDHKFVEKKLITQVGGFDFLTEEKFDVQMGWMSLYRKPTMSTLPTLRRGDSVRIRRIYKEKRTTKPPPRFNEASLLREMEKLSLGTPSTRASIIETLLRRKYIVRRGKTLYSTPKGREVISKLGESKLADPSMTSEWEKELEAIYIKKMGEEGHRAFLKKIKEFVNQEMKRLITVSFTYEDEVKQLRCFCGGDVKFVNGVWKCERCNTSIKEYILGKRLTESQIRGLFEGKRVKVSGLRSKKGKKFSATLFLSEGKLKFDFSKKS
ncbi:DNA topoisomerase [Sulfolobales archaeon HS-7]|nr:DNA topoisomerase [Sulfolobales archaeon HS-7]